MTTVDLLLRRRSVPAKELQTPGPDPQQVRTLLEAAHRVPDHGKLGPWRFVVFEGDARVRFGEEIGKIFQRHNPEAKDKKVQAQQETLTRAPLVIAVISTAAEHHKIPHWEQVLSAGAVCQNLLIAAAGMGFGAQWLTEWYSYDPEVKALLGLNESDQIAGFIYVGSYGEAPQERVRPSLDERIQYW